MHFRLFILDVNDGVSVIISDLAEQMEHTSVISSDAEGRKADIGETKCRAGYMLAMSDREGNSIGDITRGTETMVGNISHVLEKARALSVLAGQLKRQVGSCKSLGASSKAACAAV